MIPNVRQASREVAVQLHRRTRTCMLGGTGGVFAFRAFPLLLLCCLPCSHTRQWRDLLGSSILTLTSSFAIGWESRYVGRHTVLVVASFSVRQKPNTSDHGNCHRQGNCVPRPCLLLPSMRRLSTRRCGSTSLLDRCIIDLWCRASSPREQVDRRCLLYLTLTQMYRSPFLKRLV